MTRRNLYLDIQPKAEALHRFFEQLEKESGEADGDRRGDRDADSGIRSWNRSERIPTAESFRRVTSEAVCARYSSPSYNSCAMDGIAVVSSRTREASEIHPVHLKPGTDYIEVDTGDPIREPFDAVIMAEDLIEDGDGYRIIAPTHPFAHVRAVGEDIVTQEMVLPSRHRITAIDVAVLLSVGVQEVAVFKRPSVAILPTGDEMVEAEEMADEAAAESGPGEGKIIETNSRMFENLVTEQDGIPVRYPIVKDDQALLQETILDAVRRCDVVLVNAGSSAGREDYTAQAVAALGRVVVHGVAVKPGKPVILGIVQGKPVIGLPGYPVASYLTFMEFVVPVMNRYTHLRQKPEKTVQAVLTKTVMSSLKYEEYVRVKLGRVDGRWSAAPLSRGAGAAMSLVQADGFCVIPQNVEGLPAHEPVTVRLMREEDQMENTLVSIGSHDLILDVLNDLMLEQGEAAWLSSTHVGSMSGLLALKKREAHLAPAHLLDERTGTYNVEIIRELFGVSGGVVLIKGVGRRQGLIVKKGNPLGIRTIEDLAGGIRYINRQRGAGTRVLFDAKRKQLGIPAEAITGYSHEAATHMAVAVAVEQDNADAGMGVYSCAKALGLDFIDIACEEYDFVTYEDFLQLPAMQIFLRVLKSDAFRRKLEELGGYTYENLGEIRRIKETEMG